VKTNHRNAFVPAWLNQAGLPQSEFRIYCCLNSHSDKDTMIAWPKAETIASECMMARNTVWKSIKALESKGLIRRVGKPFQGSSRYLVLTPTGANGIPVELPTSANEIPVEESPIGANEMPPTGANEILQSAQIGRRECPSKNVHQGRFINIEPSPEIPFSSEAFREAWQDWQQHRKEKKKPLTPTSARSQFKAFIEWGEARSIVAIEHSIRNGWQGVFEPKQPASGYAANKPAQTVNTGRRKGHEETL
jgi:DNA-binding MarR family transcriptional regulator